MVATTRQLVTSQLLRASRETGAGLFPSTMAASARAVATLGPSTAAIDVALGGKWPVTKWPSSSGTTRDPNQDPNQDL